MIECEYRALISKEKYEELLEMFKEEIVNAPRIEHTIYLKADNDLRIQYIEGSTDCKMWIKTGKIHDGAREEVETHFRAGEQYGNFNKVLKILELAGHKIKCEFERKRVSFEFNGMTFCLDDTKDYGYILEIEKVCQENEIEYYDEIIKATFGFIKIEITPQDTLDVKFKEYLKKYEGPKCL